MGPVWVRWCRTGQVRPLAAPDFSLNPAPSNFLDFYPPVPSGSQHCHHSPVAPSSSFLSPMGTLGSPLKIWLEESPGRSVSVRGEVVHVPKPAQGEVDVFLGHFFGFLMSL